jgi:AcrR family transcriptional regulator
VRPAKSIAIERKDVEKAIKTVFARVPDKAALDDDAGVFERLRANRPKQERSLRTLNRLLDAAEQVLEEEGLEAATVPVIAKRAGVSVGVVYRRFPNKDALIRGVYERFLWRVNEQNSLMLSTLSRVQFKTPDLIRGLVRGSVEGHRRKRKLLRALHQFARTHDDPSMKREAAKMNRAATSALTALMLSRRGEIKHPDPETAIEFAVLTLASVIRSAIVDEDAAHGLTAPENLEDEITRMLFAYLGIPA